jgi:hypothetical protein
MSQAQLDLTNFKLISNNEFSFDLYPKSKLKSAKLTYSKHYRGYVLNISINKNKSFIITSYMWRILLKHFDLINNALINGNFGEYDCV